MTRRPVAVTRRLTDAGSATLWVLAVTALVFAMGAAATIRATAVLARHRAELAADLAALAAATAIGQREDVCTDARRLASANRADLASCSAVLADDGRSGTVTVRVRVTTQLPGWGAATVVASARAGRLGPELAGVMGTDPGALTPG